MPADAEALEISNRLMRTYFDWLISQKRWISMTTQPTIEDVIDWARELGPSRLGDLYAKDIIEMPEFELLVEEALRA